MKTITATTKSGTAFELTADHRGVSGKAKGLSLGSMKIEGEGAIKAAFPQKINGQSVRVGAEFDAAEWGKVVELYEYAKTEIREVSAAEAKYDRDTARTLRGLSQ